MSNMANSRIRVVTRVETRPYYRGGFFVFLGRNRVNAKDLVLIAKDDAKFAKVYLKNAKDCSILAKDYVNHPPSQPILLRRRALPQPDFYF
jgi:hypothetical protein